jgi:putative transposase
VKTDHKHTYLELETDAYSKKIMGWCIYEGMKVALEKNALKMATKNLMHNTKEIISHSDRGIQYCCPDFTDFAKTLVT